MEYQNEGIQRPNWWKRNWKWAAPVGGCGCLLVVAMIALGMGVFSVFSSIEKNTPREEALALVNANPMVAEILGTPIENDGFGSYNIKINNGITKSEITQPIKGPKGEGSFYALAEKVNDEFVFEIVEVTVDGSGQIIKVLGETNDNQY